ncbi:MAG TPA: hypothetical protein VKF36_04515 [Syntrophorhabdales bacterium]|nr:hypothetical protein [Syntrophorhabdales bacterium]
MKLKTIDYSQYIGKPEEWRLSEASFGDTNLVVGRNAAGKTRTLNVVKGLAELLSMRQQLHYRSGNYDVIFEGDKERIAYTLKYDDGHVKEEKLRINDKKVLTRGPDGSGRIRAEEIGKDIRFQTPVNEVAACAKRDAIQHPFLDPLYEWGKSLVHFCFGTSLGKDIFVTLGEKESVNKIDDQALLSDTNQVQMVFRKGRQKFGKEFVEAIKRDMKTLDYQITNIGIGAPTSLVFTGLAAPAVGLFVEEAGLRARIDQGEMSQGMFRSLSVIIQVNYVLKARTSKCILIDDIGEGLDYERSSSLVKLLMKKAEKNAIQLFMATNDRFIMNSVPLEHWSVVNRYGSICSILNRENSPKVFEDFELTGLGNFDFFTSGYYLRSETK